MSAEYNTYIIEHVDNVKKAYFWLKDHNIIKEDILDQLNLHDASKYTEEEYKAYDLYFYGTKTEKVKKDFDYAWLHHIHENPHHWQHWVLVNDDEGTYALEMSKEFVYEMICDWWSVSWSKDDPFEIFDWYEKNKKKIKLSKNTRKTVEDILDKLEAKLTKVRGNKK